MTFKAWGSEQRAARGPYWCCCCSALTQLHTIVCDVPGALALGGGDKVCAGEERVPASMHSYRMQAGVFPWVHGRPLPSVHPYPRPQLHWQLSATAASLLLEPALRRFPAP